MEDGKTGIIVPARDSSNLAEAIKIILTNPDIARRMGEAGRRKALAEFDELLKFRIIRNVYLKAMSLPPEV